MLVLFGNSAMSEFRRKALLESCRKLSPKLQALSAQTVYLINGEVSAEDTAKLSLLLGAANDSSGDVDFLVVPREGTISPWASKATDIALNCGLPQVQRIERGTGWKVDGVLSEKSQALLFDRMTEMVLPDINSASVLFADKPPARLREIDVLSGGVEQLRVDNQSFGFALSDDEIDYLVNSFQALGRNPTDAELMMFAQANSEHCRHKIFNASWEIDGVAADSSLFAMIRETHSAQPDGTLVAYDDNAAVIEGYNANRFMADPTTGVYFTEQEKVNIQIKVETHNHPTAISPFPGAATGAGGEIRDEGATGNGAKPKAGLCGFSVSNLRIPGFTHKWEQHAGLPSHIASSFQIMQEGPIGAAAFNNEFGRPNLTGYFRTLELKVSAEQGVEWRGYHKPIMIAGGLGNIRPVNTFKKPVPAGSPIVVLGGPAMLIGLGGGAASSLASGQSDESLDFASVQRGNPEMQRRCQEVINHCVALADDSPVLSMHDVGAGGLSNALPELVHDAGRGAHFELRDILIDEQSMSPMEIWCNESQERYVLALASEKLSEFEALCLRERCPYAVVGTATEEKQLTVTDRLHGKSAVDMSLQLLLGKPPRMQRSTQRVPFNQPPLALEGVELADAVERVFSAPSVACKNFLITIGDRSVGGLVHRDQLVGPWQVPVADCAVTLADFTGFSGEAMSVGERTPLALIAPEASGRMAVAEALTNLICAPVGAMKNIKLSANWMAAASTDDASLFDTVQSVVRDFCLPLGLSIPVGKDSLSMQSSWQQNEQLHSITSPLSLVVTAFAPVADVRKAVTPCLVKNTESVILLADIGAGKNRLGGSALAQVYEQVGDECPDVESTDQFAALFTAVQNLIDKGLIVACHDRSDGGAITALAEMCFAGHCGAELQLNSGSNGVLGALFNEEIGLLLQVLNKDLPQVMAEFQRHNIEGMLSPIANVTNDLQLSVRVDDRPVYQQSLMELKRLWWQTSYKMQYLRDNPTCADQEFERAGMADDPGIQCSLTFDPAENIVASIVAGSDARPRLAVLREQGVNGQVEMAAAFQHAGFECVDVHMSDIISGTVALDSFNGLAACGGFSYGDVLGAGGGWANSILYNARARDQFEAFFNRSDVFALGVCNGCQMFSHLRDLIPGASHWPTFRRNLSEQFEARFSTVLVQRTPSVLFTGMEGSTIPVVVSHGEGLVENTDASASRITLRYVDNFGQVTESYPDNPNGSAHGVTGLCNDDGRFNIMMPHPERVYRSVQNSFRPDSWPEEGPWLRLFRNARYWVSQV